MLKGLSALLACMLARSTLAGNEWFNLDTLEREAPGVFVETKNEETD